MTRDDPGTHFLKPRAVFLLYRLGRSKFIFEKRVFKTKSSEFLRALFGAGGRVSAVHITARGSTPSTAP